jgi:hypothetical protein
MLEHLSLLLHGQNTSGTFATSSPEATEPGIVAAPIDVVDCFIVFACFRPVVNGGS